MKITKKDFYLIIENNKKPVENLPSEILQNYSNIENENVVVNISKFRDITLEELLNFLEVSNKHRLSKQSFVIVNDTISIDEIPEELIIVPTLLEAEDIIRMEDLERELGF